MREEEDSADEVSSSSKVRGSSTTSAPSACRDDAFPDSSGGKGPMKEILAVPDGNRGLKDQQAVASGEIRENLAICG